MRLFFAISIPQDLKDLMGLIQQSLSDFNNLITWVKPGQAHISLRFLGNQPDDKLPAMIQCSNTIINKMASFSLCNPVLEFFPSSKYPRVLLIDFKKGATDFLALQKRLDEALQKTGLVFKNPKVTPHLSIGRIKEKTLPSERQALVLRLSEATRKPPRFTKIDLTVKVQEIHLIQSQLTPQGSVYTTLNRWRLD